MAFTPRQKTSKVLSFLAAAGANMVVFMPLDSGELHCQAI